MSSSSSTPSGSPFLRAALVLVILASPFLLFTWKPVWFVPDEAARTTTSVGMLIRNVFWVLLPYGALGALAAFCAGGGSGLHAGLRRLVGRGDPADDLLAHHALAASSRAICSAGFLFALISLALLFQAFANATGGEVAPARAAQTLTHMITPPLLALVLGRLLLAVKADAAALGAGEHDLRVFSGWSDLSLFVLILPAAMGLLAMVIKF